MRSLLAIALLGSMPATAAQNAPPLGAAASFAVLAGSSVRSSRARIGGNVGVSPGDTISGSMTFVVGEQFRDDVAARTAQRDNAAAYKTLAALPCTPLTSSRPPPGVYCLDAPLPGTLILDARGVAGALWVFRGNLATAPGTTVLLLNGGSRDNVFWQVPASATLGAETLFAGNILAVESINIGPGAHLSGRALAQQGSVTLGEGAFVSMCCPLVTLSPQTLPAATIGTPYNQPISPGPAIVTSGSLPPGLTPAISGTPMQAGKYVFTLTSTVDGCAGTAAYEIDVSCPAISDPATGDASPITGASTTLPPGKVAVEYSQQLPVVGGVAPYTFKLLTASDTPFPLGLPPGLSVSPTGLLSGTPAKGGSYRFNADVTSSGSCLPHRITYSVTIFPIP